MFDFDFHHHNTYQFLIEELKSSILSFTKVVIFRKVIRKAMDEILRLFVFKGTLTCTSII